MTQHPWETECEHPGEYLRMGDHADMTGRFEPDDLKPDTLYCLRCEQAVEDNFPYPVRLPPPQSGDYRQESQREESTP